MQGGNQIKLKSQLQSPQLANQTLNSKFLHASSLSNQKMRETHSNNLHMTQMAQHSLAVQGQANIHQLANSTLTHYNDAIKIQLPEIMQQQQTKINQMKRRHEQRFQHK